MNTLSIPSPSISSFRGSSFPLFSSPSSNLGFCCLKPLLLPPFSSPRFPISFNSPGSPFPLESQLSDVEDDEEEEEDDDDDEEAAEEYDYFPEVISDGTDEESESLADGRPDEVLTWRKESKWERVDKIRKEVKEFGNDIIDVDELASIYDFRIDKFQRLAIEAFLNGSSAVVSAPTSSGKTLIAEAAAVATVARGKRIFYTTPLKALSNQKFRDFRETFGDENVGLLTGDSAVNKDAQVLIMTTEILRNMLYQRY